MGTSQELYEIEKQLKNRSGKTKNVINKDELDRNLSIFGKYNNYVPNFSNISLICASNEYKKSLTIDKYEYKEKLTNLGEVIIDTNVKKKLSFDDKQVFFRDVIDKLKISWEKGADFIRVDRNNLIETSIEQLNKVNFYKELKVSFLGDEDDNDAGGIMREWMTVLFKELEKEEKKLFERADTEDCSYKVYNGNEITPEKIKTFNFIGKVLAKALLENITVNTCFNIYIFKIILDEPVTLDDLYFVDKFNYNSFLEIYRQKDISNLMLFFAIDEQNDKNIIETKELITNGSNIPVSKASLDFYLQKKVEHLMNKDKLLINQIKKSLFTYIPENLIKIFNASQLEMLINGTPFVDVNDWYKHTKYIGYKQEDEVIKNFWKIIRGYSQEELSKILQFSTGSSRVPIGGFGSLLSNRGKISLFCISKVDFNEKEKNNNFIKSHTCFNRIDLPEFPDYDSLKEGLSIAMQCIYGFTKK